MPVLQKPVKTRLEILRTIYRLAEKQPDRTIKLDAAQIDGGYYAEINYQLRFLQERNLVDYKKNFISRKFYVSLTSDGVQLIDKAYHALSLNSEEKDKLLDQVFAKIKA